jgi:uncharacterized protein (DUF58 family)
VTARPTARGLAVLIALAAFVATGVAFGLPALTALGALGLSLLPAAWVAANAARTALREARLTWSHRGRVTLDRPSTLGLRLELLLRPHRLTLEPAIHGALTLSPPRLEAPDLTCLVTAHRLGDAFIHGLVLDAEVALGLVRVRLYRALPLTLQTLPFRVSTSPPELAPTATSLDASDLVRRDRRGFGMEVRELRDFAPGDPFKHIAWRATARRGKLIVREFESELQRRTWLLVDTSPSMFAGPPGQAPIDVALTTAVRLIDAFAATRDEVGLILHDHTVRALVEPSRGEGHAARMLAHLLEAPHLLHEDRTEVSDPELLDRLARFRTRQHGASESDERSLISACRRELARHKTPLLGPDAYAPDADRSLLRAYARLFGVPLPLDPTPRPNGQAEGLLAALEALVARSKRGSGETLIALTDLATIDGPDVLKRFARLARIHRQSLIFALPAAPPSALAGASDKPLADALIAAEAARLETSRATAQALLRPAGAQFVTLDAQSLPRLLATLRNVA